jgi:adenylate kinase family enzyme
MSDAPLGRRIVVYGVAGSGKTSLARHLGATLGIGVIELDAIRHADGWDSVAWPAFRDQIERRLDAHPEGWVCDGNYSLARDISLPRADTAVWLHLPLRVTFWRLLKRTVERARTGERLYEGSPARESWLTSFLSPKSILVWSLTHHRRQAQHLRRDLATIPHHAVLYELRSAATVAAFLRDVDAAVRVV